MRTAEGLVVVGEDVGRIVVARLDLLVEPAQTGTGIVFGHGFIGIHAVGERRASARIALLIEAVGEVARDAQRLERRDDQSRGVREIAPAIDVAVRALVEHDVAAVGDLVGLIRRTVQPRPVGILHRIAGQCVNGAVTQRIVDTAIALRVVVRTEERRVVRERRPLVDPKIDLRTQVVLVVDVGECPLHTGLTIVSARNEVLDVLRAATQRYAVLLHGALLAEEHVPPVVVAVVDPLLAAVAHLFDDPRTVGVFGLVVHTRQQLLHVVVVVVDVFRTAVLDLPETVDLVNRPVTAVFIVGRRRGFLPAETAAVTYRRFAVLGRTGFGRDQNDAERRAGTVDGGGRCVLDDRNRLDVVGVDAVQIAHDPVDQHERIGRVDRVHAADVDRGRTAGLTRRRGDVQTGDRTLKHVGHRVGDAVLQLLAAHRRHGARQVDALLRTVTDDDRLFELDGVFLKEDRNLALRRGNRHFLGNIAQIRGIQNDLARWNFEREAAVFGGRSASGRTVDQNSYSYDRLLLCIEDFSRYRSILGKQG